MPQEGKRVGAASQHAFAAPGNKLEEAQFDVLPQAAGQTLRTFLGDALPLDPEEFIRHLVVSGKVLVGDAPADTKRVLHAGETIAVQNLSLERKTFRTEVIRAEVLYEDNHILVLNKPAGCTVVRERSSGMCAFQNGVLEHLRRLPASAEAAARDRYRPRAVHRLDRDTTGAVVFAKSRAGELWLAQQFQERTVAKEYLAVVHAELASDSGTVEAGVASAPGTLERMCIDDGKGKPSATRYEVAERFRGYTLVRAFPHTGRRHQIRVHFAHIGHPLVADRTYGGGNSFMLSSVKRGYRMRREDETEKPIIARPALHASAIMFLPVGTAQPTRVEAPLPRDFRVLLKMLRKYAAGGGGSQG